MKALSVKQPWANMIASGMKTIETRTWRTKYRGSLLIVSSRNPKINPWGRAVAIVTLIDCRPMVKADEIKACCKIYDGAFSWIFEDVLTVKNFKVKGNLRLYEVNFNGY